MQSSQIGNKISSAIADQQSVYRLYAAQLINQLIMWLINLSYQLHVLQSIEQMSEM